MPLANDRSHINILVIGTGGTIAGVSQNSITDYRSGETTIGDVMDRIKASPSFCVDEKEIKISTIDLFNKNSDDITIYDLVKLTELINSQDSSDDHDGYIITHGTDTMEESAFFLSLSLYSKKPVIMTGSMIPGDNPDSDSIPNMAGAITSMTQLVKENDARPDTSDKRSMVYVYFNGKLMNGSCIRKTSTNDLNCFEECPEETIGLHNLFDSICDFMGLHNFICYSDISCKLKGLHAFPSIPILPFYMDADPGILDYYVNQNVKGIVIAGAGAGEMSLEFIDRLRQISDKKIPVIRTSKIKKGPVNDNGTLNSITISGGCVSPEKAAILLRVILALNNV